MHLQLALLIRDAAVSAHAGFEGGDRLLRIGLLLVFLSMMSKKNELRIEEQSWHACT